jgi:hypothetical protein
MDFDENLHKEILGKRKCLIAHMRKCFELKEGLPRVVLSFGGDFAECTGCTGIGISRSAGSSHGS